MTHILEAGRRFLGKKFGVEAAQRKAAEDITEAKLRERLVAEGTARNVQTLLTKTYLLINGDFEKLEKIVYELPPLHLNTSMAGRELLELMDQKRNKVPDEVKLGKSLLAHVVLDSLPQGFDPVATQLNATNSAIAQVYREPKTDQNLLAELLSQRAVLLNPPPSTPNGVPQQ